MLLAMYGTLKVGYFNYDIYLKAESPVTARFIDVPYEMFANEEYPMLLAAAGDALHRIWVEIFDVDEDKMRELDELEARYDYWREDVFVEELGSVSIYVHAAPAPEGFIRVESGKWE